MRNKPISCFTAYRALAVVVLGLGAFGTAQAQWTVTDPGHSYLTQQGWLMQGKEYLEQAMRWKQEYEHYQQQLADAQKVFEAQSMQMTMDASERPLDFGLEDQCKRYTAGDTRLAELPLSNAPSLASAKANKKGDIYAQQHIFCAQIVYLQNGKYNELVKMLKNIQQRDKEVQGLNRYRSGVGTSEGRLATSNNQISSFSARMQVDMQYVQTAITTYDGAIADCKKQIQNLAKAANDGAEQTVFNALMQGAALKGTFAALRAARSL